MKSEATYLSLELECRAEELVDYEISARGLSQAE